MRAQESGRRLVSPHSLGTAPRLCLGTETSLFFLSAKRLKRATKRKKRTRKARERRKDPLGFLANFSLARCENKPRSWSYDVLKERSRGQLEKDTRVREARFLSPSYSAVSNASKPREGSHRSPPPNPPSHQQKILGVRCGRL